MRARRNVTVGFLILGLIGTDQNTQDKALELLAMPVPDCAHAIICATQARWIEGHIPTVSAVVDRIQHDLATAVEVPPCRVASLSARKLPQCYCSLLRALLPLLRQPAPWPQLDSIFGTIARFNTRLAQTLVEYIYVWNVPRYIERLARVSRPAAGV